MAKGFGEDLWHNAQAVRLDHLGGLRAPVRADGRQGIVVGASAVARAEAAPAREQAAEPAPRGLAALLRRLTGRA